MAAVLAIGGFLPSILLSRRSSFQAPVKSESDARDLATEQANTSAAAQKQRITKFAINLGVLTKCVALGAGIGRNRKAEISRIDLGYAMMAEHLCVREAPACDHL